MRFPSAFCLVAVSLASFPGLSALPPAPSVGTIERLWLLQEPIEEEQVFGSWRVFDDIDLIDDTRESVAETSSEDARLALICRSNGSLVLLVVLEFEFTGSGDKRAIFRVDQHDPLERRLPVLFEGSFSRLDWTMELAANSVPTTLISQARTGELIVFRTFGPDGLPITKVFALDGFSEASDRVLESCDYSTRSRVVVRGQGFPTTGQLRRARIDSAGVEVFVVPAGTAPEDLRGEAAPPGATVSVSHRELDEASGRWWYLIRLQNGARGWVSEQDVVLEGGVDATLGEGLNATGVLRTAAEAPLYLNRLPPAGSVPLFARPTGFERDLLGDVARAGASVRVSRWIETRDGTNWYLVETDDGLRGWVPEQLLRLGA